MVSMGETPRIGFGCTLEHRTARNVKATGEFAVPSSGLMWTRNCWRSLGQQPATRRRARSSSWKMA